MNNIFGGAELRQPEYPAEIEARLQKAFQPVVPRQAFKRELKNRLLNAPEASLAQAKHGLLQYVLLTTAGLLSGTLILIFGVRAVQHLKTDKLSKATAV
jgi:hypothetical protein